MANRLNQLLHQLTQGFSRPSRTREEAEGLVAAASALGKCDRDMDPSLLDAGSKKEVIRKLVSLAQALASLDAALCPANASAPVLVSATERQLHAGVVTVTALAVMAIRLQVGASDAYRVACAATLVLRSGRFALEQYGEDLAAAFRVPWQASHLLGSVLLSLEALQGVLRLLAGCQGTADQHLVSTDRPAIRAFLATTAAPVVALPWLRTATAVLQAAGTASDLTEPAVIANNRMRGNGLYCYCAYVLLCHTTGAGGGAPPQLPTEASRGLHDAVMQLLLTRVMPMLAATWGAALQPDDGQLARAAQADEFGAVCTNMIFCLASGPLIAARRRAACQPGAAKHVRQAAAMLRVLQGSWPAGEAASQVHADRLADMAGILGTLVDDMHEGAALAPLAERAAACWAFVQLAPHIGEAVRRLAAAPGCQEQLRKFCGNVMVCSISAKRTHGDSESVADLLGLSSAQRVQEWAASTEAVLHLVCFALQLPQRQPQVAGAADVEAVLELGLTLLSGPPWRDGIMVIMNVCRHIARLQPGNLHGLAGALWRLHTLACRVLHACGGLAAGLPDDQWSGFIVLHGGLQLLWQCLVALVEPLILAAGGDEASASWARSVTHTTTTAHYTATLTGWHADQRRSRGGGGIKLGTCALFVAEMGTILPALVDASFVELLSAELRHMSLLNQDFCTTTLRLTERLACLRSAPGSHLPLSDPWVVGEMCTSPAFLPALLDVAAADAAPPEVALNAKLVVFNTAIVYLPETCLALAQAVKRCAAEAAAGEAQPAGIPADGPSPQALAADTLAAAAERLMRTAAATLQLELTPNHNPRQMAAALRPLLPHVAQLAAQLLQVWRGTDEPAANQLALAQAAAARSCAYLSCSNVEAAGGPAMGEQAGSKRCSGCKAVRYCGTECSHLDWKAGHHTVCKALAAGRAAEQQRE